MIDTLPVLVDTLPVVVDTLPAVVDSLTQVITTTVSTEVATLISLGLAALIKVVVDLGKMLSTKFAGAPDIVKTFVAVFFGQVAAWASTVLNIPVSADPTNLGTTLVGVVLAVLAMGVHSAVKALRTKK
jgi:phage-related minor tail protein